MVSRLQFPTINQLGILNITNVIILFTPNTDLLLKNKSKLARHNNDWPEYTRITIYVFILPESQDEILIVLFFPLAFGQTHGRRNCSVQ